MEKNFILIRDQDVRKLILSSYLSQAGKVLTGAERQSPWGQRIVLTAQVHLIYCANISSGKVSQSQMSCLPKHKARPDLGNQARLLTPFIHSHGFWHLDTQMVLSNQSGVRETLLQADQSDMTTNQAWLSTLTRTIIFFLATENISKYWAAR